MQFFDANDPKPTSRNSKTLAADSVPLRTNLEPSPKPFARLWGLAQVAKIGLSRDYRSQARNKVLNCFQSLRRG